MISYKDIVVIISILFIAGCASYRTNSPTEFEASDRNPLQTEIQLYENDLSDSEYKIIGEVEAVVKKLTVFHKSPTKEQVNVVLAEKAKNHGADAVIFVFYKVE